MIKTLRRKFILIAMCSMAIVLVILITGMNLLNYYNMNRTADTLLEILRMNDGNFPLERSIPSTSKQDAADYLYRHKYNISAEAAYNTRYFTVKLTEDGDIYAINTGRISATTSAQASDYAAKLFEKGSTEGYIGQYKYLLVDLDAREKEKNKRPEPPRHRGSGNDTAEPEETDAAEPDTEQAAADETSVDGQDAEAEGNISNDRPEPPRKSTDGTDADTASLSGSSGARYMYIFLDCESELSTFRSFLIVSTGIGVAGLIVVFFLILVFSGIAMKPVMESNEKQKRFITDASHEIKTPLTIIDANTEILEMTEGENEWTQSIRNQIRRLTDLTEKMVFLTRMDEGSTQMTMLDFSLSDAVTETVEPFLAVAATRECALTLDIEPNITLHGDEAKIRQLVSLLVDNALKYCPRPGEIRVGLASAARGKVLTVWNTVEEIEPGNQDRLFDRFYRRDSSRNSKTGGHGIGLSVAQAIVLAHKGRIFAKSEDGRSIQFTVILP